MYPTPLFSIQANVLPFRLGVVTGDAETDAVATDAGQTSEQSRFPGGIIGFRLSYTQMNDC